MADNNEIQTSRITGAGPGSSIDDHFRNFEQAYRTIFGVTADSDVQECAQIGSGPNVTMTGTLTLAGAPSADLMAATKAYVDGFAGSASSLRATLKLTSLQTITGAGGFEVISWDGVDIEEGGDLWDVGTPTRLKFPVAGDYLIGGVIEAKDTDDSGDAASIQAALYLNGATWLYTKLGQATGYFWSSPAIDMYAGISFAVMEPMSADDYVELYIDSYNSQNQDVLTTSKLWTMKVG